MTLGRCLLQSLRGVPGPNSGSAHRLSQSLPPSGLRDQTKVVRLSSPLLLLPVLPHVRLLANRDVKWKKPLSHSRPHPHTPTRVYMHTHVSVVYQHAVLETGNFRVYCFDCIEYK